MKFDIPILLIIFNKIKETQKVFNAIREQNPSTLFIAGDGPRSDKPGEKEKCEEIRKWVHSSIDWDCEIKTFFHDQNIGCGRGPSEAITWFFDHVEEGIILEDDCLPNNSFFQFCEENLFKYRNNQNVSIISGNNFQIEQPMQIEADYYFSIFPSTNGWATWKSSWQDYNFYISKWNTINKEKFIKSLFREREYQLWWKNQFDMIARERPLDMWDFQFYFLCMDRKQLAIIPKANLVTNIGYGPDATHSQNPNSYFANVPLYELNFPLTHPNKVERNYEADLYIQKMLFGSIDVPSPYKIFKRWVKRTIKFQP